MKQIIMGALLFFFSGLGVAYAAQTSTPGQILYPVKVGVNEQLASAITIDGAAETELQAKIFAERVEEAVQLGEDEMVNSATMNQNRRAIGDQFQLAFSLIEKAEAAGNIAEAAVARTTMQTVIEHYMYSVASPNDKIKADLTVYSRIMTESFINLATDSSY